MYFCLLLRESRVSDDAVFLFIGKPQILPMKWNNIVPKSIVWRISSEEVKSLQIYQGKKGCFVLE